MVMGIALMTGSSSHSFEMEVARREVKRCEDVHHMREICLSMIDLLEGQRDFLLDSILRCYYCMWDVSTYFKCLLYLI